MYAWKVPMKDEGLNNVWAPNDEDFSVHIHELRIAYECAFIDIVTNKILMILLNIIHDVLRNELRRGKIAIDMGIILASSGDDLIL